MTVAERLRITAVDSLEFRVALDRSDMRFAGPWTLGTLHRPAAPDGRPYGGKVRAGRSLADELRIARDSDWESLEAARAAIVARIEAAFLPSEYGIRVPDDRWPVAAQSGSGTGAE